MQVVYVIITKNVKNPTLSGPLKAPDYLTCRKGKLPDYRDCAVFQRIECLVDNLAYHCNK